MIYTGYYARLNEYIDAGLVPISIAGKAPKFYCGYEYKTLAPKYDFFIRWKKGEIDNFKYVELYNKEVLSKLDAIDVCIDLYNMSNGNAVVLLCYEKPGDFCHRHIVADWLEKHGEHVEEFVVDKNAK